MARGELVKESTGDAAASAISERLIPPSKAASASPVGSTIANDLPPSIAAAVSSRKSASRFRFSATFARSCSNSSGSFSSPSCSVEKLELVGESSSAPVVKAREPRKTMLAAELVGESDEDPETRRDCSSRALEDEYGSRSSSSRGLEEMEVRCEKMGVRREETEEGREGEGGSSRSELAMELEEVRRPPMGGREGKG